jgi:exonuclease III
VQSSCDVVCLQETKREAFDRQFLNNLCPSYLDAFVCLPSVGAFEGILIL